MMAESQFRCDVAGPEALAALRSAVLPAGLLATPAVPTHHRDIYLDTADKTLVRRGVSCRLRVGTDDRRILSLFLGGGESPTVERFEALVPDLDPRQALAGDTEPARRLRGLVDPSLVRPRLELEVERWSRAGSAGWLRKRPRFAFLYDSCTLRHSGLSRTFEEIQVRRVREGAPRLEEVAHGLESAHGLRPLVLPRHERAGQLIEVMAAEAAARMFSAETAVVLVALDEGKVGFLSQEGSLALPTARGSGEEAVRHLLRRVNGSSVGNLSLLGSLPATEDRDGLEVWVARRIRHDAESGTSLLWLPATEAIARVGTPQIRAPETLAALAVATRANLFDGSGRDRPAPAVTTPRPPSRVASGAHQVAPKRARTDLPPDHFLNAELAQLAFQQRVLEMAEDPGVPLAERLRFLAIVSANLDEFFAVRVGALKAALLEGSTARGFDGLTPRAELEAIHARIPPFLARVSAAARECLAEAARSGVRVRAWDELADIERDSLSTWFERELLPVLTPRAVTMSPGHPFPLIPQFVLTFGVVLQDVRTGPVHFASLPLKARVERFVSVPGSADLIPVEEVIRANIQAFYPDRQVAGAWLFRITRAADLEVDDEEAGDLLQAIEEEVQRRPGHATVRVEIERAMPEMARDMILRELRFERRGVAASLGMEDFFELDPPLDLTALRDLASRLPAGASFSPFRPRAPFPAGRSLFDQMDAHDLLVHHPEEDFTQTVARFLEEAADDPDVLAIRQTLYRVGDRSPVVEALIRAAERGKEVAVFVELKARFDESRNVQWVRRLEDAGAQVVYGLAGHKIHAKVALVVRRHPDGLRRYAHVGTGNYNAATARFYTDAGLFTTDTDITADLTDLFNQLTGSSRAPSSSYRRLLVAPATMLSGFLGRIEREAEHARAGRGGRIRAQLNGLEDPEVVAALYKASQAGVEVDLVVRSFSVLRPGVPGVSDRIRVRSVLGRFLEHQRIYHFGNGGEDEYLIGSADWRPRNLRRRVEVVTPVRDATLAGRLGDLLTALLAEPSAWQLDSDGQYHRLARPTPGHPHIHERLIS